jgi:DNA-binding LacI/PurR family transcriptional regulator
LTTLKEVAKRADVSTATVSKVLSNTPYVSQETRERVLKAVEELGYVPNLAARALSKGLTYNIAVVFPYNFDSLFADPLILRILEGIEAICTEHRYNMLLSTPRIPVSESEQYQNLVRSGYLDGAIVFETLPGKPVTDALEQYNYPWVAIGYHAALGESNTFHSDDFGGAKAIASHFIGLGHRRFGIVSLSDLALTAAECRIAGYAAAFAEAGLDFGAVPKTLGNFSDESGFSAAGKLLSLNPRPTAILCLNDRMALGVIERIKSEGLHVPGDISVGGFDDIPAARLCDPPLTTVQQHAPEMGSEAAHALFNMIDARARRRTHGPGRNPEFPPRVFPATLVIRGSSVAPRA